MISITSAVHLKNTLYYDYTENKSTFKYVKPPWAEGSGLQLYIVVNPSLEECQEYKIIPFNKWYRAKKIFDATELHVFNTLVNVIS